MHIKHMHEMIEHLAEYGKSMIEAGVGEGCVNLCDAEKVVGMIEDLAEAEYHSLISKAMKKCEEEEEEEEKILLKMLKEEYKDDYKRMREEYGEEEGERRFYDSYRHANGRFARKGTGMYMSRRSGRRGYEEMPYAHMPYDYRYDMDDYGRAEHMRDMDRHKGVMYFTEPVPAMPIMPTATGMPMHDTGMRDMHRESRFDRAKRGYEETKEMHKGNTPEEKQAVMKEADRLVNVGMDAIEEALAGSAPEVINMVKAKMTGRIQKLS